MKAHVDVQASDESVRKQQAPRILKVVFQPHVMIVEEVQPLLWRVRLNAVNDRPFYSLIAWLALDAIDQVHMQRVQDQTGFEYSENRLVSAPACGACAGR